LIQAIQASYPLAEHWSFFLSEARSEIEELRDELQKLENVISSLEDAESTTVEFPGMM
jgi:hypothetical protein